MQTPSKSRTGVTHELIFALLRGRARRAGAVARAGDSGCSVLPSRAARSERMAAPAREVGVIVGGGALKEHLTKTTDAKAAIHSWVAQNSLETPSCQPAHELLDSMGFSRAEQHKGVMNHLKDRLLARIDTMPQDKRLALLEKCFPYVTIPELRAVPIEILSKLPRVPVAYFAEIAKDAKLMAELPLAVRRQVWVQKVNPELFKSYILSLIRQYSLQPQMLGLVTGTKGASAKFKKARAANKALQDIVAACADIAPLYRETLDIIGQAYLDDPGDLALCSLRLQLPLAALEAGTKHVADTDACYKLAKSLCDAARDKVRASVPARVRFSACVCAPPPPRAAGARAGHASGAGAQAPRRGAGPGLLETVL